MSCRGPRPHRSPLHVSSNSMIPFAPRLIVTTPSSPCAAWGMKTPVQPLSAACTSARCTICAKRRAPPRRGVGKKPPHPPLAPPLPPPARHTRQKGGGADFLLAFSHEHQIHR